MNLLRGEVGFKLDFRHFLLKAANIRRIHIIGCSRSGTTMLHYSMVAFKETILCDKETDVWNLPGTKESMSLFMNNFKNSTKGQCSYYITKRSHGWWKRDKVEKLLSCIDKYNIFTIYIARDPRDVLTSRHPPAKGFYVKPGIWHQSIESGEYIMNSLKDYPDKLTIKYEDIVLNPSSMQKTVEEITRMRPKDNTTSWSSLKANLESSGITGRRVRAMHTLRNFDGSSIGRWRTKPVEKEYIRELLGKIRI